MIKGKKILIAAIGFDIVKLSAILKEQNFKNDYEIIECKDFADAKEKNCDVLINEFGQPVLSEKIIEIKRAPSIDNIDIMYSEKTIHKKGKNSWKNQNKYHN